MAQLVGVFRLGRDAELRYTQGGKAVASLSLAYAYGQKGEGGKKPTQWIDAALWDKQAEASAPYLKKGGLIYCVITDPHIETFARNGGESGFKLTGRIAEFEFVSSAERQPGGSSNQPPPPQQPPQPRNPQGQQKNNFEDLGDDIPF